MTDKGEIEELRLPVPWGFVAAKAWGSVRDSKVLVIHGLLDNAGSYNRLIPLLPKRFYYVCIDLPGHGFSSHFPAGVPLDFLNYILCIELVIRALEWKNFIYIGHSLGSILGCIYTSVYPGRVEKMIALDIGLPIEYTGNVLVERVQKIQEDALKIDNTSSKLYSYDDVIYALKYKRMFYLTEKAAEALFERAVTKVGNHFKYNRDQRLKLTVRPLFSFDQYLSFFKRISVPILFILTSVSASMIPTVSLIKNGVETLKSMKTVQFEIVEGNHDVHNNYPERLVPIIEKFLNDNVSSKL